MTFLFLPNKALAAEPGGILTGGTTKDYDQILTLIEAVTNWVLYAGGAIAVAMIIWGGLVWGTSSGNEERVTKGRKIFTAAIIGLIIVIASRLLIVTLIQALGGEVK